MTVNTTSENVAGKIHGPSTVQEQSCEPANEVEMVEDNPPKVT